MTPHIESNKEDIAKIVLMPGDPLRAKYIADTYLTEVKLVNKTRNMFAYTGFYKGTKVTVFPSGMGIPSIGIYAYELFTEYDVDTIIRIGTAGSYSKDIHNLDLVLVDSAYSKSSFPYMFSYYTKEECFANEELNNKIFEIAHNKNININRGRVITSDYFGKYIDNEIFLSHYPTFLEYLAVEMESFGLLFLAALLDKKASAVLSIVDSIYEKEEVSPSDREHSLNEMIELVLDSVK